MPDSYTINHYENFPVASILLPKPMRRPIAIVYRFARSADDFADEGEYSDAERLALLDGYRQELQCIAQGKIPVSTLFQDLQREVITPFQIPIQLFFDLLDAFSQDVRQKRYADMGELMQYARRSANPVGRIVLHIAGQASAQNLAWSDGICAALQFINFWQDIGVDWQKGRVYIPQEILARFGVTEQHIAKQQVDEHWQAMLKHLVEQTRHILYAGSPLGLALPGRLGLEIRLTLLGGDAILRKIIAADFNIFKNRPKLGAGDWPVLFGLALFPALAKRKGQPCH